MAAATTSVQFALAHDRLEDWVAEGRVAATDAAWPSAARPERLTA
jgi:hypothetical protein